MTREACMGLCRGGNDGNCLSGLKENNELDNSQSDPLACAASKIMFTLGRIHNYNVVRQLYINPPLSNGPSTHPEESEGCILQCLPPHASPMQQLYTSTSRANAVRRYVSPCRSTIPQQCSSYGRRQEKGGDKADIQFRLQRATITHVGGSTTGC